MNIGDNYKEGAENDDYEVGDFDNFYNAQNEMRRRKAKEDTSLASKVQLTVIENPNLTRKILRLKNNK